MLQTGTILQGRYEILRLIAKGGMGAVYEGRDLKFGGSPVAVKRCLLSGEAAQRAFVREAELLANLSHPGVAKVRDFFAEADGRFLVMEYIPGRDLEEILGDRGQPIPIEDALEWMDQALAALSHMHSQHPPVVHRDIKPSNLKLTPSGHVMLIDFGLAKGKGQSSLVGYSASYAPLEQLQDDGTDARSDLYSLGATLYRLLTGQEPESALARVKQLAKDRRDPLLKVNTVNHRVPPAVAQVVWEAMALEREDRLPSADEMRRRLREAGKSLAPKVQPAYTPTEVAEDGGSNGQTNNGPRPGPQSALGSSPESSTLNGPAAGLPAGPGNIETSKMGGKHSRLILISVLAGLVMLLSLIGAGVHYRPTEQETPIETPTPIAIVSPAPISIVSPTPTPVVSPTPEQKPRLDEPFTIQANNPWLDTGIEVEPGMTFEIEATGTMSFTPEPGMEMEADRTVSISSTYSAGPDGLGKKSGLPCPNAGIGALILRIRYVNGAYSNIIAIGRHNTASIDPNEYGRIMLGINDNSFDDNTGNFQVRVRRIR